eukprot:TRINITY_DN1488_c0_g1_i8.p1 TRINITY_DN1488_c0_g1~~TRINITY_DN1488_c0_g1_i8.p1  ORF type:complete len:362 (+),score=96.11 TRINITY_DN1488_c0_g1_i8:926-2011(+)
MEKKFDFRGVQCSKDEAETACWGVTKPKGSLERLYFKLPKLGDDEVRLKMLYAGLCHSDYFKVTEEWCKGAVFPLVPGHEIIAEVEKVGANVKNRKPGDVVGVGVFRDCCGKCKFCMRGDDQLCTETPYKDTYDPYIGGYSTRIQLRADFTFDLPKNLDKKKAAPILCAGTTVFSPLKRWGAPGIRCGVIGIGGLGHMAVQIASKMGMHVVALSTSTQKEKEAKSYGAKEFICSKNEEDMKKLSKDKVDLMLNTAFIPNVTEFVKCVNPGGCFVQLGIQEASKPTTFSHTDLIWGQKVFTGSLVGSRREVREVLEFCSDQDIAPVVECFKWPDFPAAYEKMCASKARYRCVVDIADTFDNQ